MLRCIMCVCLWALSISAAQAHLCDNVFRQADKLIVKPENYNLTVKDRTTFKIFLQNNMDRAIAEISLIPESQAFSFTVTPHVMSIPKDARVYFEVTMRPKKSVGSGSYPVNFRLVGGGRQFKSFSLNTLQDARLGVTPMYSPESKEAEGETKEKAHRPEKLLQVPVAIELPVIDGTFSEALWKKAAVASNFSVIGQGEASSATLALITYDDTNLYIGIYACNAGEERNSLDDTVTIRLTENEHKGEFYEVAIPISGTPRLSRINGNNSVAWQPQGFKYAVANNDNSWNAEMVIPFTGMQMDEPVNNQVHYIRLTREKTGPKGETSVWSADESGYNTERGFGAVTFVH